MLDISDEDMLEEMSEDELWDWYQAPRLWEKKAVAAAPAEEAPKKAMQKCMKKAAAPAERAPWRMKKEAASAEEGMEKGRRRLHWKGLKKRMKRAVWRRAPGEPPPEKPSQKGTLKNQIIKAKFVKRNEHLIPSSYLRALWWPKKGDQESHESQAV